MQEVKPTKKEKMTEKYTAEKPRPVFGGYTLEELRYRRAVESIKIDIEKDRLMREIYGVKEDEERGEGPFSGMQRLFRYGQIAFFAYNIFKKGSAFFRGFKNKR